MLSSTAGSSTNSVRRCDLRNDSCHRHLASIISAILFFLQKYAFSVSNFYYFGLARQTCCSALRMGSCNSKNSSLASSATTADQYHRQEGGSSLHQTKNGSSSTNIADKAEKDSKRVSTCSFNYCGTIEYSFFFPHAKVFYLLLLRVLYAITALVEVLVLQQRGLRMYVAGSLSSFIRPPVYAPVYLRLSLEYPVSLFQRDRVDCRLDV